MNSLLVRQLRRNKVNADELPGNMLKLLEDVSKSYDHQEIDRSLIERSIELSSQELTELNKKLRLDAEKQKVVLNNLKFAVLALPEQDEIILPTNEIEDENLIVISDFLAAQIQKRKEAENKLKLYERAIYSSNNGIIITDPNLNDNPIIFCNPSFLETTGYAEHEVIGKNCRFLQGDDKNQEGLTVLRNAISAKKSCAVTLRNFKKNGTPFWNELEISPIFNNKGELTNFIGTQSDITARKNIESDLNELKVFYEQTLNELSGRIAVFDSNFRYLYVNPGSMSNPDIRHWLIGKDEYELCKFLGLENSVAELRIKHLTEARNKNKQVRFEEELRDNDGSLRYFEWKISPIFDSANEIIRYIAYGVDITEIKLLVKKLEYSNKALTDFAYIASHDLREPLRKISAFGSLLKKTLTTKLNVDENENLNFMIDGAKRMQQMVGDLLYYSRITKTSKIYSLIDIDELLNEIIKFDLSQIIEDNYAEIIIENKLGSIKGEKTQIKQLFQNLIGNGIKYRNKSVTPVINIRSRKTAFGVEFQIEDNGIGIDAKYTEQIFEMFKRLHSKEEYEGSGIGLAVCKKIIELYNGEIEVKSEPGLGSTFIFSLLNKE